MGLRDKMKRIERTHDKGNAYVDPEELEADRRKLEALRHDIRGKYEELETTENKDRRGRIEQIIEIYEALERTLSQELEMSPEERRAIKRERLERLSRQNAQSRKDLETMEDPMKRRRAEAILQLRETVEERQRRHGT
jgi:tRNA(Ile)-lysidine synthase TilS/MesJ